MGKPRDARGVAPKVAEPIEPVDTIADDADEGADGVDGVDGTDGVDADSASLRDRAPPSLTRELTRVEEANIAFYDAFHRRDIDRMSQMWSRSPHARCVHPGWELVI